MVPVIGLMVPIILFIVVGFVIALVFQLKSKEKQMMIEKGLSTEQIVELLKSKDRDAKNRYYMLKGGIILIFLVIGGIIGNMIDRAFYFKYENFAGSNYYDGDTVYGVWIAFLGLGVGAVAAHFIAKKVEMTEEKRIESLKQLH
jgi:lipoprotein signal peptidase